jgi:hypothetical protein
MHGEPLGLAAILASGSNIGKDGTIADAGAPSSGWRHLLPVNGAKGAVIADFANHQRCRKSATVAVSVFLPVNGEKCPAGQ